MSGQHKVAWLCEAFLVSRSGYYDWKKRRSRPGRDKSKTLAYVSGSKRSLPAVVKPTVVLESLMRWVVQGRRNRIARLMRKERLFARQRSKYRVRYH